MKPVRLLHSNYVVLLLTLGVLSCKDKSKPKEQLFHAAGSGETQSVGAGLGFALYNDNSYAIFHGLSDHKGSYSLAGDTITLHDFEKQGPFKHNRLMVIRYDEQDSTYWMEKYSDLLERPPSLGRTRWQVLKAGDYQTGEGDVYQLDLNNRPLRDAYYFNIAHNKLKTRKAEK